jgi:outer membrane protein
MRKWLRTIIINMASLVVSSSAFGADLIDVYHQALKSDPTFKAAEAQYLAAREAFPISQANLLPLINLTASIQRQYINGVEQFVNIPGVNFENTFYNTQTQYNLSVTQPVFNYSNWMAVRNAINSVKAAQATYFAAAQDLMMRVATAYFNVLQAYDNLVTVQAQKKSLGRQLDQTIQQFKVGLIAITGVEQTKASYDSIVAQEIFAKNQIADNLEVLRTITGVMYSNLKGIKGNSVPLVSPYPEEVNRWVEVATRQNYTLLAANYTALASRENIREVAGQHLPAINATANYAYDGETNFDGNGNSKNQNIAAVGLTFSMPVYTGGLISAETRQASQQYAQASANRELSFRTTASQTRQSYLGVISGVSRVRADLQAVYSSNSALQATQAGYNVGTQTIVDVLTQQTAVFNSRLTLTTDQYAYLISTLTLKEDAGTLSQDDLAIINCWLRRTIDFSSYNPAVIHGEYRTEDYPLPTQIQYGGTADLTAESNAPLPVYNTKGLTRSPYTPGPVPDKTTPTGISATTTPPSPPVVVAPSTSIPTTTLPGSPNPPVPPSQLPGPVPMPTITPTPSNTGAPNATPTSPGAATPATSSVPPSQLPGPVPMPTITPTSSRTGVSNASSANPGVTLPSPTSQLKLKPAVQQLPQPSYSANTPKVIVTADDMSFANDVLYKLFCVDSNACKIGKMSMNPKKDRQSFIAG